MPIRRETIEEEHTAGLYEDYVIKSADPMGDGRYGIRTTDGMGFSTRDCGDLVPKEGDIIRVYGGYGYPIHGLALNGQLLFWLTPAEQRKEHREFCANLRREREERFECQKEQLDRDFDSLPELLKRRISGFRLKDPNFRVEGESYEMFCCTQAALMAEWAKQFDDPVAELRDWTKRPWEEQLATMPGFSEGHSNNTFGASVSLAIALLYNQDV